MCLLATCLLLAGTGCRGSGDQPRQQITLHLERLPVQHAPEARFDASLATDGRGGRVFLFGGRGEKGFLSDLWLFSPGNGGWRRLARAGDGPGGRSGASLVWDDRHDRLYLFGGWRADEFGQNHFLKELWTWKEDGGWNREFFKDGPVGRAWQAAGYDAGSMLLIGGYAGQGRYYLADAWRLDGEQLSFTRLITDGRTGIAGKPELLVFSGGRGMFLFGRAGWRVDTGTAAFFMLPQQDTWVRWNMSGMPPADYSFCAGFPGLHALVVVKVLADDERQRARAWLIRADSRTATTLVPDAFPRLAQGMTCTPHPDGGPRDICFGGVRRNQYSTDTWLVELLPGRTR